MFVCHVNIMDSSDFQVFILLLCTLFFGEETNFLQFDEVRANKVCFQGTAWLLQFFKNNSLIIESFNGERRNWEWTT